MKTTRDIHDIVGGLLMTAAGLFFALYGSRYTMGTADRMGPGYFPIVLGWVLAVLGILVALPAWWRQGSGITVQWKNLIWCVASLVAFALGLKTLGVVAASFIAALLALVPSAMPLRTRLTVCAVVAGITALIFPLALQMVLPIWPWSL
ncbi:tripartite tricarboxylate transporter TctB family protein [Xenophilus sp. Marseille-Q4582]|uniref:tripartite tricarboxylate transporter TctB family protein n=1 Tax=Xenophilus sp. Marseille-Q4582 TaxID=2866600 RepID=UPI001CE43C4B|nr:tripartite tricarboxylate transporter TctB family protein [Xenophilus sp. Marseille-Q4582]